MSPVNVVWKGNCRSAQARTRLLNYLQRLARLSDSYLRPGDRPHLTVVGEGHRPPRANIELVDELCKGEILVSSDITEHPERLIARAREAGLPVRVAPDGDAYHIVLDEVRVQGIDFRLFDPRGLYPDNDRMSFVFIDCPEHHFLDGRLVKVTRDDDTTLFSCPSLQLQSYLEDWTDCLFSWIRFFLMGDLWWRRHEELHGYNDYRGVFEVVQTTRGSAVAEDATFEAVVSTFTQHAEHWRGEVQRTA
ncbi:hypothetical protein AUC68_07235 [Methyloceanibacter methanicus]|uniref:Uncharacterized protein n=1 Tax=Methyloceanibacter methanicus TaxID=1774968 RepID=A0A1E3VZG3_9HYPH|nr:hypothetical protein [Methyloceanibacter methanicus]ODR98947.1 hypothetical protein AUC68_07235 [Methyloceanibacter methanicus]